MRQAHEAIVQSTTKNINSCRKSKQGDWAFTLDKAAICRDTCAGMMNQDRRPFLLFFSLVAIWCGLIVAAPLLRIAGVPSEIPDLIYRLFSRICHQLGERSFHLGGEKFGVCVRCSAIYGSFLLALLCYPFLDRLHRRPIPPPAFLAAAVLPMVVDVFLHFFAFASSTVWSRVVTGALFGAALPWYILPPLLEAASIVQKGILHVRKAL